MASLKQAAWRCPRCLTRFSSRPRLSRLQARDTNNAYHASARQYYEEQREPNQAQPLSGYYADILATPTPYQPPVPRTVTTVDAASQKSKEDRARVVFGSRKGGPGYERISSDNPDATWRTVNGMPVPPRPVEPDNCCMSGCVNCVWDDYQEEVEGWMTRLKKAKAKSGGGGGMDGRGGSGEVDKQRSDDDGQKSETHLEGSDAGELFSSIPIGIREFMRTEKRLRERKKKEKLK